MRAPLFRLLGRRVAPALMRAPTGDTASRTGHQRRDGAQVAIGALVPGPAMPPAATVDLTVLQVLWHELRTPIVSVKALAGALDAGEGLGDGDRREMARLIVGHARHLADLLDAVRLVADVVDGPVREEVAVVPLVAGCTSAACLVDAVIEMPEDVGTVIADGVSLRRVLTNLLENARVHGAAPVQLRVELSRPGRPGWCASPEAPQWLSFTVSDAGAGIPPEVAARTFGGAWVGGATPPLARTRQSDGIGAGSGLGLWIVSQLVASMAGRIELLSPSATHATRVRVGVPVF